MAYSVKTGLNQTLASLVAFFPQPRCEGLQYVRSTVMADRSTLNEGAYFVLLWDVLPVNASLYNSILGQAGLSTLEEADVTVTGPARRFGTVRYNAKARLPLTTGEAVRRQFFLRSIQIMFTDLTLLP